MTTTREMPPEYERQPEGGAPRQEARRAPRPELEVVIPAPEKNLPMGLHYFRPHQVTLLLRPDEGIEPPDGLWVDAARQELFDTFRQLGAPLAQEPFLRPGDRDPRGPRVIARTSETLVSQTLNLEGWRPSVADYGLDDFSDSLLKVVTAVRGFNDSAADSDVRRLGPYRVEAAAPNWYGMPF